jgi:hypothetical protein
VARSNERRNCFSVRPYIDAELCFSLRPTPYSETLRRVVWPVDAARIRATLLTLGGGEDVLTEADG